MTVGRLNIENSAQAVSIYRSPADTSKFMQLEANDEKCGALAGLFDHLSWSKNLLVDFHLDYDVSNRGLALALSTKTAKLVTNVLERVLVIAADDARVRLNAAIAGLATLSAFDGRARSLNKRLIEFRTGDTEEFVIERTVAE